MPTLDPNSVEFTDKIEDLSAVFLQLIITPTNRIGVWHERNNKFYSDVYDLWNEIEENWVKQAVDAFSMVHDHDHRRFSRGSEGLRKLLAGVDQGAQNALLRIPNIGSQSPFIKAHVHHACQLIQEILYGQPEIRFRLLEVMFHTSEGGGGAYAYNSLGTRDPIPPESASRMLTLLLPIAALASSIAASTSFLPRVEHPFLADLPWDANADPHDRINDILTNTATDGPAGSSLYSAAVADKLVRREWDIPTSGLPPYPASSWVAKNSSGYAVLANAGVRRMQSWFISSNSTYEATSWWQLPVILQSYIDLDRALGDSANKQVIELILNDNERGVNYMIDAYVDDQAWWGLIAAKAYELYGNEDWLSAAKAIQADDASWWTDDCGGGLLWLNYKPDYGKNTVTNTLQIALSARLYRITGDESYLDDAVKTLDWWQGWAYENSTGKVWDTIEAYTCETQYLQTFTYNSAIIIGALVDLYEGTKTKSYLTMAQTIAYAAMRDFSSDLGILEESCEHDGPPDSASTVSAADGGPLNNLPAGCQSDTIMFKAILAQNLGYLYEAAPDVVIYNYLTFNFVWNAIFNLDDTFLFGEWWGGPFNATLANQLTQGTALGLLSAGVAVQFAELNNTKQAVPTFTKSFQVPLPTNGQNGRKRRSLDI
ncbi:glycoside hydrolase family 76 protein [Pseudohyphozyma bogoriensis]|nr:glycoside hydrolase family 76 protein [Pseudohyphozyma bogoriensis]